MRRGSWWVRGRASFAFFLFACSRAATVPHDFDARRAIDHVAPRIADSSDVTEEVAVLLVPSNATLARPNVARVLRFGDNLYHERYVGPARVFLPPGKRSYTVSVATTDGPIRLELTAEFEAGKRYRLDVIESDEHVAFELFELRPNSYAALYPGE